MFLSIPWQETRKSVWDTNSHRKWWNTTETLASGSISRWFDDDFARFTSILLFLMFDLRKWKMRKGFIPFPFSFNNKGNESHTIVSFVFIPHCLFLSVTHVALIWRKRRKRMKRKVWMYRRNSENTIKKVKSRKEGNQATKRQTKRREKSRVDSQKKRHKKKLIK